MAVPAPAFVGTTPVRVRRRLLGTPCRPPAAMARRLDPRELPCPRPVAGAVRSDGGVAASPANARPRMYGDLTEGLRMPLRPAPARSEERRRGEGVVRTGQYR